MSGENKMFLKTTIGYGLFIIIILTLTALQFDWYEKKIESLQGKSFIYVDD